jgi:aspartyl-tRNA(Asn)/glutamyl-tRNA(Gln) amidotransferase subunit C
MRITPDIVAYAARLSRLELTEAERERFGEQLNAILDHFAALDRLSTEGVEATSHAIRVTNVFRDDQVGASLSVDEVMAMAPESRDGFVVVPRVIEPGA